MTGKGASLQIKSASYTTHAVWFPFILLSLIHFSTSSPKARMYKYRKGKQFLLDLVGVWKNHYIKIFLLRWISCKRRFGFTFASKFNLFYLFFLFSFFFTFGLCDLCVHNVHPQKSTEFRKRQLLCVLERVKRGGKRKYACSK